MITKKIYVHVIGGSELWIPVKAQQLKNNLYKILNDKEYDLLDTSELFEFLPGDIVWVQEQTFLDGTTEHAAKQLFRSSSRTDRKYWEFLYLATTNRLILHTDTYYMYEQEIQQIKRSKGQYFYPAVLDVIERLDQRISMTKKEK